MTRRTIFFLFPILAASARKPPASIEEVLREEKLERRADSALDYAEHQMELAGEAYNSQGWDPAFQHLEQVRAGVEAAFEALEETGRRARRSKHHKSAEIRTRKLVRMARQFDDRLLVDERPHMEPILRRLREIHEDLLNGVMGIE